MARQSVSQQLSELREYTARLEIEHNAAQETIRLLKQKLSGAPQKPQEARSWALAANLRSQAARTLCSRLGVNSVTRDQVDQFLASH